MSIDHVRSAYQAIQDCLEQTIELYIQALPPELPGPLDFFKACAARGIALSPGTQCEDPHELLSTWIRYLAHLSGIPIISAPRVRSLDGGGWRVRLRLPLSIDTALCQELVDKAVSELAQLTLLTAEQIQERYRASFIDTLRHRVPGGASTLPVLESAYALGIPYMHLGHGIYQLGLGSRGRLIDRSATRGDSAIGARIAGHKGLACHILAQAGIPVPEGSSIADPAELNRVAERLGYPLVIKPADAERGEGVSVGVDSRDGLLPAYELARSASRRGEVIVERQLPGICHRVFVAGGRVLYVVKRWPPCLLGDGRSTLMELAARRRRSMDLIERLRYQPCPYLMGEESLEVLAQQGLAPDSIPAASQRVPLRAIENSAWGGVDEDMTDRIHPDYRSLAVRSAELLGLDTAGVDIMCEDISRPFEASAGVIEVNFAPLLGGAEISRSHLPEFLGRYLGGGGLIPFERFGGPGALNSAQICVTALRSQGLRVGLVADPHGQPLPKEARAARVRSLALRRDVDAIVVLE